MLNHSESTTWVAACLAKAVNERIVNPLNQSRTQDSVVGAAGVHGVIHPRRGDAALCSRVCPSSKVGQRNKFVTFKKANLFKVGEEGEFELIVEHL